MLVVISYDISEDKIRQKVAKKLGNYGQRVQYSVFECILKEDELRTLAEQLQEIINESTDSVRFYRICMNCKEHMQIIGKGEFYVELPFVII